MSRWRVTRRALTGTEVEQIIVGYVEEDTQYEAIDAAYEKYGPKHISGPLRVDPCPDGEDES